MRPSRLILEALAESDLRRAAALAAAHHEELARDAPHVLRALEEVLARRPLDDASGQEGVQTGAVRLAGRSLGIADRERLRLLARLVDDGRAARAARRHRRAGDLAREGADLVLRMNPAERARILEALPGPLIEWSRDLRGDMDFAVHHELLDRAYTWAISSGDLHAAAVAAGELASDRAFVGRTADAERWLSRVSALTPPGAPVPPRARLAQALIRAMRLDIRGAIDLLDEILPDGVPSDRMLTVAVIRVMLTAVLHPGELPRLAQLLADLDAAGPWPTLPAVVLAVGRARLSLMAGLPERALEQLHLEQSGPARPLVLVHRALAHLVMADYPAAELEATDPPDAIDLWPRCRIELTAIAALARLRLGDPAAAATRFRDAVGIAQAHQDLAALTVLSASDLEELAACAYAGDVPALLAEVIGARLPSPADKRFTAPITPGEERVLRALLDHPGMTVVELAAVMGVSVNTIKTQLSALLRKTGMENRAQLVRIALQRWDR